MRVAILAGAALTAGLALAPGAHAQERPARSGAQSPPPRAQLEQRIRQRFATVLQERLQLSDEQARQLQATQRRFAERRRALLEQERDVRIGLRDELLSDSPSNQERVARLLDQMLAVQRQRISLVEEEQRELAGYLTPVQRAKYLALQDQLQRRLEEMRRHGRAGPPRRSERGTPPPR